MEPKHYTISQIAKEVGVSTTTISRYCNGHYEYMSKSTRERIREAIERYNYRPSLIAKGLKVNKGYLFGVIMPHVNTSMSSTTIRGICQACSRTLYSPLFMSVEDDESEEKFRIQSLLDHRVEGIITMTGCMYDKYQEINASGIPVVACDRFQEGIMLDSVTVDHRAVIWDMMVQLRRAGYTQFAVMSYDVFRMPQSTIYIREKAITDYCALHGLECHSYAIDADNQEYSICSQLNDFRSQPVSGRRAVFATNAPLMFRVERAFLELGINYPDEIGLIGYDVAGDDYNKSRVLTVIEQPVLEMAEQAFALLINRIEGREMPFPQRITLLGQIIKRSSVYFDQPSKLPL